MIFPLFPSRLYTGAHRKIEEQTFSIKETRDKPDVSFGERRTDRVAPGM